MLFNPSSFHVIITSALTLLPRSSTFCHPLRRFKRAFRNFVCHMSHVTRRTLSSTCDPSQPANYAGIFNLPLATALNKPSITLSHVTCHTPHSIINMRLFSLNQLCRHIKFATGHRINRDFRSLSFRLFFNLRCTFSRFSLMHTAHTKANPQRSNDRNSKEPR